MSVPIGVNTETGALMMSPEIVQLSTFDDRFYEVPAPDWETSGQKVYYNSITAVLGGTKVAHGALDEYKQERASQVGREIAAYELWLAGRHGTHVHAGIEKHINGEDLVWREQDEFGNDISYYDDFEWKRIARFMQWEEEFRPTYLFTERAVYSHTHKIAGTFDALARIGYLDNKVYILDWKISKDTYEDYLQQVSAYDVCLQELLNIKVDGAIVLALGAERNKKGWKAKILDREELDHQFKMYKNRLAVYRDIYGEDFQPKRDILPSFFPGIQKELVPGATPHPKRLIPVILGGSPKKDGK